MDHIGRYQIVRELGRGAMGVVYLAVDPNIGRQVAIKVIRLGEVTNTEERARLRERLFREARSAGMLSHPGIVTIYDVQEEDEVAYIAMEYVNGPTLDQLLSGEQPLSPAQMFSILGQNAVALDYAHQKGIVHRDVKPANIMIAEDGSAKITDFGIAKIAASTNFTMTGTIIGTPNYMSPEQIQGLPVDGRSDQFSLCVIAFEMLTGERPFAGEHLTTVVFKIVAEEAAQPRRLNPTLSPQIEEVLRRGLSKKQDARYRNCGEFVDALETACKATKNWKALPRSGSLNIPTASGEARPMLPPVKPRARLDSTTERERSRVGVLPIFFAILVAAGLVGLIAWQAAPWLSDSNPKQAAVQTPPQTVPPTAPAPKSEASPQPPSQEPEQKKPSPLEPAPATPAPESPAPQAKVSPPGEAPPEPTTHAVENPKPEAPKPETPKPEPAQPEAAKPEAPKPEAPKARTEVPEKPVTPPRRTPSRPPSAILGRSPYSSVWVPTSPAGARAVLDGRADTACTTPCGLEATPGRHTVSISMPGYQLEQREVNVTSSAQELPMITLRAPGGTLMLSTNPPGASIFLNGRELPQKTPAQLNLALGKYTIEVEKDGQRSSEQIEIRNGINVLKIPLGQ